MFRKEFHPCSELLEPLHFRKKTHSYNFELDALKNKKNSKGGENRNRTIIKVRGGVKQFHSWVKIFNPDFRE